MDAAATFRELFDRMPELVRDAVGGFTENELAVRLDPETNSIAWLIWHLARVEDDHVAGAAEALGRDTASQAYTDEGFFDRFGLPFEPSAHGYGHTAADVAEVRADGELLVAYYDAVHARTDAFLADVADDEWDAVVDPSWEPPVTLLVRVASVANEVAQHVGQAAILRGVIERRRS